MNKMLTTTALIALLAAPGLAQAANHEAGTAPADSTTTTPAPEGTTAAPADGMGTMPADGMGTMPADGTAPAADGTATTTMPADGTTAPATMDTVAPTDTATTAATGAATGTDMGFGYTATATDVSAETFIGKNLYVSETDVDTAATYNDVDAEWNDIGTINDLVIDSTTGQVRAVIVDIGGFLGLGARSVSVSMDQLRLIRDGDSQGDYFIVFTSTREQLENAPEFEWNDMG
ncbi:PRC-barrel domain containing protein [Paracoccus subflavus]|uniref:PRC-barrel domain containing protein n=1 Tax=Paracoccus subflavus TaxID=2528244 RepID=A0A4Q9FZK8_9RHOB|nr:PRC-barrel domain-containing protein [Paracoccus subflavus]TBN39041.1 PRC-barrel domain containing protein [Paracoccus subflavus]